MTTTTAKPKVKKATNVAEQVSELMPSSNGGFYKMTSEGKVKKVTSLQDIFKLDIPESAGFKDMNRALYRFLKENDPSDETFQKNQWVYCRGFKMRYSAEEGFTLIDTVNFGLDLSDEFEDSPTPKDVWALISLPKVTHGTKKKLIDIPKRKEEPKVNLDLKEAKRILTTTDELSDFKVKALHKNIRVNKEVEEDVRNYFLNELEKKYPYLVVKEELDFTKLRKRAIKLIENATKADEVISGIKKLIPNRSFNVFFGKLVRKFKDRKIRAAKLYAETIALLKDDSIFEEKKKPAPKFVGTTPYMVHNLLNLTDTEVEFTNSNGNFTVSRSAFLCNYMLHHWEKMYVGVMKLLRGEITKEQFIDEPEMKDKFCEFDAKLLKDNNSDLVFALEKILRDLQEPNPLNFAYANHYPTLKDGSKVNVVWPDYYTDFEGTIINLKGGISIRYEDGTVTNLMIHQPVTIH